MRRKFFSLFPLIDEGIDLIFHKPHDGVAELFMLFRELHGLSSLVLCISSFETRLWRPSGWDRSRRNLMVRMRHNLMVRRPNAVSNHESGVAIKSGEILAEHQLVRQSLLETCFLLMADEISEGKDGFPLCEIWRLRDHAPIL